MKTRITLAALPFVGLLVSGSAAFATDCTVACELEYGGICDYGGLGWYSGAQSPVCPSATLIDGYSISETDDVMDLAGFSVAFDDGYSKIYSNAGPGSFACSIDSTTPIPGNGTVTYEDCTGLWPAGPAECAAGAPVPGCYSYLQGNGCSADGEDTGTLFLVCGPATCTSPRAFPAANPTVTAGVTKVTSAHFINLMNNINYLRTDAGLSACGWTQGAGPTARKVYATDINDLRSCLAQVYTTCNGSCGATGGCSTFNVTAIAGSTKIRATDIANLVTGVNAAP